MTRRTLRRRRRRLARACARLRPPRPSRPSRNLAAGLVVAAGLSVTVYGVTLVSAAAGAILAGLLFTAAGALAVDVDALRGKPQARA